MNPDDYQKVKEIFNSILEIRPEGRGALLDEKCAGDGALRGEVERLLVSFDSEYMEQPAIGEVADVIVPDELGSGRQIGRYTIIRSIGKGGMGEVYLAADSRLARQVALKVLPDDFAADGERLRRFEQEAQAASALNHPNILTIYEFAEDGETHFLAAEFVGGQTLRQVMTGGALSVNDALDIANQVTAALDAAHRNGIIHRDIKPENIMLRDDGLVKVLDFGLAKFIDQASKDDGSAESPTRKQLTTPGVIMGTVRYMSPEQTRGNPTDARTDLWSLGCVLYEMLAGRPAFAGDKAADMIAEIVKTHPAPIASLAGNIPERLDEIVAKTLEKNPDERYQTAKDLLIDLKRLKRKCDLETEMQRSHSPATHSAMAPNDAKTVSENNGPATQTVSSAQYLLSEIKGHKRTAIGALVLLLAVVGVSGYFAVSYWRGQNPNGARFTYAANIRLAAEALETSNLDLAKQLLDATRPKNDEEDLRGFEWGYLSRLHAERIASQPITLKHEGWVNSVAFSADGKMLATGSNDAHLWDVSTGHLTATLKGHSKPLVSVAISADGTKLATGSFDKTAKLWDISTGQMLWTTIASTGTGLAVGRLVFSQDGKTLSGEDDEREARAWEVATGNESAPDLKFDDIRHPLAVSPDGKFLAAQSPSFIISVFDIASTRKIASLDGKFGFVTDVVFAPDSKSILTAGSDKIVKLWSLPTGKEIRTFTGATGGLAFSPNGMTIATGSKDTIKLSDVEKGYEIATFRGHANDVIAIAFSPDGRRLASGSIDNTAKIWNVPSGEGRGVLRGHTGAIKGISFSHDSKLLASASQDKTAKIWDIETERERRTLVGHTDHVNSAVFSPDQGTIATSGQDRSVKIWDIGTGLLRLSFNSIKSGSVSYSPDGKHIATSYFWDDDNVRVWDAATGELQCSFPIKSGWEPRFSKDGRRITATGENIGVKLWDASSCGEVWSMSGDSSDLYVALFRSDGKLMALQVINNGRSLRMIDPESGKELATFSGHDEELNDADLSPNGKRLVTGDKAGLIKIWDIATGQELLTIKTDLGIIEATALSPNGNVIAAFGGVDRTVRLFRAADFSR